MSRLVLVALFAATLGAVAPASSVPCDDKPMPGPITPRSNNAQPAFEWNDEFVEQKVTLPSLASCATLAAALFAPSGPGFDNELPAVVVLPPSGGVATQISVMYVARYLASNGYVAITIDPTGVGESDLAGFPPCTAEPQRSNPSPCRNVPFQQMDNWMDAMRSGVAYMRSADNPWAARIDAGRLGAVGHSLGARAASYVQDPTYGGTDAPAVQAVVGLDNLSSNYYADASAASGGGATNSMVNGQPFGGDEPIAVRAPGLGLASDGNDDPDTKKTAYSYWRSKGAASGMLVFDGVAHGEYSQTSRSDETFLRRVSYYTLAWFDRWLKADGTATQRLLARDVVAGDVQSFLSDTQRSAFYLPDDGVIACEDFRAASC